MFSAFYCKDLLEEGNLSLLMKELKEECSRLSAKKSGGESLVTRRSVANKYLKDVENYRQSLKCAFIRTIDGISYQCFVNGFTAIILNDAGQLPDVEDARKQEDRTGEVGMNLGEIVNAKLFDKNVAELLDIAPIVERDKSKLLDARNTKSIDIGCRRFNAKVILPAIRILGGTIYSSGDENENAALFLKSENGYAIILPMRK